MQLFKTKFNAKIDTQEVAVHDLFEMGKFKKPHWKRQKYT